MKQFMIWASALALAGVPLAGPGARAQAAPKPQYPVREGEQAGPAWEALKPNFPIRLSPPVPVAAPVAVPVAAVPAASVSVPAAVAEEAPTAAPSGSVRSAALPDLSTPVPSEAVPVAPQAFAVQPLVYSRDDAPAVLIKASTRSTKAASEKAPASKKGEPAKETAKAKPYKAPNHVEGGEGTYTVAKGDTVTAIASRLGISTDVIIKMNGLKKPYALSVGKTLKVPAPMVYVVQSGDSYYAIARRFGVGTETLTDLNKAAPGGALRPGQKVQLPSEVKDRLEAEAAEAQKAAEEKAAADKAAALKAAAAKKEAARLAAEKLAADRAAATRRAAQAEAARLAADRAAATPAPVQPIAPPVAVSSPASPPPAVAVQTVRPPVVSKPVASAPVTSKPVATAAVALPPRPLPPVVLAPRPEPRPAPSASAAVTLPAAPVASVLESSVPPTEAEIIAAGRGRFVWPVRGDIVSGFGLKPGGQRNDGINIGGPEGSTVRSAASGEVVYSGNLVPGFGNLVLIKHDSGWVTAYAHLARTAVKIKDRIIQGQEIGAVGRTGGVDQPQLHFELRYAPSPKEKARPIDPALVMPR